MFLFTARLARLLSFQLPFLVCLFALGATAPPAPEVSSLKPDEEIIIFPVIGYRASDTALWEAQVSGCVYEPEPRGAFLAVLESALWLAGVSVSEQERSVLRQRARLFMVDHERRKRIFVTAGGRTFDLGRSARDGMFSGLIRVTDADVRAGGGRVRVEAVLPGGDSRCFSSWAYFPTETGVMVISDIDDTVKITSVRDSSEMLRNTFLQPFNPIPGMAGLYSGWCTNIEAQFCYVSASPWQLWPVLSEFLETNGFPAGPISLKHVRWKDRSLAALFENPEAYKPKVIAPLLRQFSHRQFILVGDSGEKDPEIYGALARKFPRQIKAILIRDVTGEPARAPRYERAFRDVPSDVWQVFAAPEKVTAINR